MNNVYARSQFFQKEKTRKKTKQNKPTNKAKQWRWIYKGKFSFHAAKNASARVSLINRPGQRAM